MEDNNEIFYKNLKILAECYETGNFDSLFSCLSEDISLDSMWVFETLSGFEKVKEYYIGKGETVRKYGAFPTCLIVRSINYPQDKLLIYMCQYLKNETAEGIIDIKLNDQGKISHINLCDKSLFQFETIDKKAEAEEWANWFQIHSKKMRKNPMNYTLSQQMRKRRADIFQQTIQFVEAGKYISTENNTRFFPDPSVMAASTVFYDKEIIPKSKHSFDEMEITVQNIDCVLAGKHLKDEGFDPAVLNMASGHNPGGGVLHGAGAQEENLFRRSNLYKSLYQFADFAPMYGIQKSKYQYPLDFHFGGIYTPDAFFFRGLETDGYPLLDEPYALSVISVPAINIRGHVLSEENYISTTKDKIRTILRIGLEHSHDALVLSAFGCGAFGNDPRVMSRMFLEIFKEQEFINSFRKIVFAIIDDHNSKGNFASFYEEIHNAQN